MINVFNSNYEEIGSLNKNLVLLTLGKIKIRYGRKYIDLINDKGELNISIPKILTKVSSKDLIKSNGFYMLDGNLYLYFDEELFQLTGGEDSLEYVKYNENLELTQEQQNIALRNIGLTFNKIEDAMEYVDNGIVHIGDKLYYIQNNVFKELFTLNEPIKGINEAELDNYPNQDNSAIVYLDNEWRYVQIPTLKKIDLLLDYLNNQIKVLLDELKIIKKDKLFDPVQYSTVYNIDVFSLLENNKVYIETIPLLSLSKNDVAIITCIITEAEYIKKEYDDDKDGKEIVESLVEIEYYYNNGEMVKVPMNSEGEFDYSNLSKDDSSFVKQKAIPIELTYEGNNIFSITEEIETLDDGTEYIKEEEKYYVFSGGLSESVRQYHLFAKIEANQRNKFKIDYNNAEIALEENTYENGKLKIIDHTLLGDISKYTTYSGEMDNPRGLYSDNAIFNGVEFRGDYSEDETKNESDSADDPATYARYSQILTDKFWEKATDIITKGLDNIGNDFDNVTPPYKAVKLQSPLRDINWQETKNQITGLGNPNSNNFKEYEDWNKRPNGTGGKGTVLVIKEVKGEVSLWEYKHYLVNPLFRINELDLGDVPNTTNDYVLLYDGTNTSLKEWKYYQLKNPIRSINDSLSTNPTLDKQILRWNNNDKKWEYVDHIVLNSPLTEINEMKKATTTDGNILIYDNGWTFFNLSTWMLTMNDCCTEVKRRLKALEDDAEEAAKTYPFTFWYGTPLEGSTISPKSGTTKKEVQVKSGNSPTNAPNPLNNSNWSKLYKFSRWSPDYTTIILNKEKQSGETQAVWNVIERAKILWFLNGNGFNFNIWEYTPTGLTAVLNQSGWTANSSGSFDYGDSYIYYGLQQGNIYKNFEDIKNRLIEYASSLGKVFSGWEIDETTFLGITDRYTVNKDITIIPKFVENITYFTVKYYNESTVLHTETVAEGNKSDWINSSSYELPTKQGYSFTGWNPDPNTTVISGNTNFIALFTEISTLQISWQSFWGTGNANWSVDEYVTSGKSLIFNSNIWNNTEEKTILWSGDDNKFEFKTIPYSYTKNFETIVSNLNLYASNNNFEFVGWKVHDLLNTNLNTLDLTITLSFIPNVNKLFIEPLMLYKVKYFRKEGDTESIYTEIKSATDLNKLESPTWGKTNTLEDTDTERFLGWSPSSINWNNLTREIYGTWEKFDTILIKSESSSNKYTTAAIINTDKISISDNILSSYFVSNYVQYGTACKATLYGNNTIPTKYIEVANSSLKTLEIKINIGKLCRDYATLLSSTLKIDIDLYITQDSSNEVPRPTYTVTNLCLLYKGGLTKSGTTFIPDSETTLATISGTTSQTISVNSSIGIRSGSHYNLVNVKKLCSKAMTIHYNLSTKTVSSETYDTTISGYNLLWYGINLGRPSSDIPKAEYNIIVDGSEYALELLGFGSFNTSPSSNSDGAVYTGLFSSGNNGVIVVDNNAHNIEIDLNNIVLVESALKEFNLDDSNYERYINNLSTDLSTNRARYTIGSTVYHDNSVFTASISNLTSRGIRVLVNINLNTKNKDILIDIPIRFYSTLNVYHDVAIKIKQTT